MAYSRRQHSGDTGWLSTLSFGFFLALFGVIWVITPNLSSEVINFVKSLHLEYVSEHVALPAPENSYPVLYRAAMQFCLVFGAFQIIILILRFMFHDSLDRKSGTFSNIAFWFGSSFFLNMLANEAINWFGFLAGLIISVGLAIVTSSLVKLFR